MTNYISSKAHFEGCLEHYEKADLIRQYARDYNLDVFVETGTYRGHMIERLKYHFRKVFSIELGAEHADHARERFRALGHIHIIQGDSGKWLGPLSSLIKEPALYFLDAHCSGGDTYKATEDMSSPVLEEVRWAKLFAPGSVILIDDIRNFTEDRGHPPIKEFTKFLVETLPGYHFRVKNDIMRITPDREK